MTALSTPKVKIKVTKRLNIKWLKHVWYQFINKINNRISWHIVTHTMKLCRFKLQIQIDDIYIVYMSTRHSNIKLSLDTFIYIFFSTSSTRHDNQMISFSYMRAIHKHALNNDKKKIIRSKWSIKRFYEFLKKKMRIFFSSNPFKIALDSSERYNVDQCSSIFETFH